MNLQEGWEKDIFNVQKLHVHGDMFIALSTFLS